MPRRELLAYLIGAGVAGTAIVLPYAGRGLASAVVPEVVTMNVPFFLLPIAWGLWNWLWVRFRPPLAAAAWGALLGVCAAIGVNALLAFKGQWFPAVALLGVFLPAVYGLVWTFVVVPVNRALDAEP